MKIRPEILSTPLDIVNYESGRQAECLVLNSYEEIKSQCILKHIGEGKKYTQDEINMLITETVNYREDLIEAGIKLPKNYRILKIKMIKMMIDFVRDLPAGEIGFDTLVLGDFKPDNFIELGGNGDIIFIDYFAPKRRGDDGFVFPYLRKIDNLLTKEAITFLCGDRRGEISRLLAIIKRQHSNLSDEANKYAIKVFQTKYPEIVDYIKEGVSNNFAQIDSFYHIKDDKYWSDKI